MRHIRFYGRACVCACVTHDNFEYQAAQWVYQDLTGLKSRLINLIWVDWFTNVPFIAQLETINAITPDVMRFSLIIAAIYERKKN